jgi:hypothetical protein
MRMRSLSFNELAMSDRAWITYEFGDFLMSIEYYEYRIFLFSLQSQFIELYQNIDTRQIEKIEALPYCALDKYLNRILIANLKRN